MSQTFRKYSFLVLISAGLQSCTKDSSQREEFYPNGGIFKRTLFESTSEGKFGKLKETFFHENGQPRLERIFKNGILQGPTQEWYANGTVLSRGSYQEGKKYGAWEKYYQNGLPQSKIQYSQGEKNGTALTWYPSGELRNKATYSRDSLLGTLYTWYENGQLQEKIEQREGKMEKWRWYPNGQIQKRVLANSEESTHDISEWYSNGQIKARAQFQSNQLVGPYYAWHQNGTPFIKANYDRGQPAGRYAWWTREGKLISHQQYRSGRLVFDSGIERMRTVMDDAGDQIPYQFLGFRWGMSPSEIRENLNRLGGKVLSESTEGLTGTLTIPRAGVLSFTTQFNQWNELWAMEFEIHRVSREKFPSFSKWMEAEIHFNLGAAKVQGTGEKTQVTKSRKWGEFLAESYLHMNRQTRNPVVTAQLSYDDFVNNIRLELKNHLIHAYAQSQTIIVSGPFYAAMPES